MKFDPDIPSSNPGDTPSTDDLEHEIKAVTDIDDYLIKNKTYMLSHNLSQHLNMLLEQKGLTKADVVRGSLLHRTYIYQIFSGKKTASRDKLIALAFGMHLSAEEAQTMLKLSGNRILYARDQRDAILLFALNQRKPIMEANELLFHHHLDVLDTSKL
ncbi:hypothetical protein IMSAGC019_02227 [Lachnospiraceae bacterium]|nr:hypothetical protein IMSAGC019_02227 [Lachnospiraceae bacterium]